MNELIMGGGALSTLKLCISGGNTGADQGGLFAAEAMGIKTGGWAPKGYMTDEGPNPKLLKDRFGLFEDRSFSYQPRTKKNVVWADGTVWFGNCQSPGGILTKHTVEAHEKPWLMNPTAEELRKWIQWYNLTILNVAGNRERKAPGIRERVMKVMMEALGEV